MRGRRIRFVCAALLVITATARAAYAREQTPQNTPSPECADCAALERALADAERAAAETQARLPELERQIQSQTSQYELGQANRAALQAKVRAGTATSDEQARLKSYDSVMDDLARQIDGLRAELRQSQEQLRIQTERVGRFRAALEACRTQPCPPPGAGEPKGDTNTTGGGSPVTPITPDLEPVPECEPCRPSAEAIEKWKKEVSEARTEVENLELKQDAVDGMIKMTDADEQRVRARIAAGNAGQEWHDALDEIIRRKLRSGATKAGLMDLLEAARARLKALLERGPALEDALNKCNESCPVPDPPQRDCTTGGCGPLSDKRVLGTIGGGLLVGTLVLLGGDDAPTGPTPLANQPAPQPQQQQQPQQPQPPAEQPTLAGAADCTACAPIDDPGGHNFVINLCPQLTGEFGIAVASITIRHRAPFVDIVGAQYDAASGAFRGTARGTVAGIPNVSVSAEGTANAQTGTIVFNYTMGSGGELPGGRPITYRITLQKRR